MVLSPVLGSPLLTGSRLLIQFFDIMGVYCGKPSDTAIRIECQGCEEHRLSSAHPYHGIGKAHRSHEAYVRK
jgi:hypothetical protein